MKLIRKENTVTSRINFIHKKKTFTIFTNFNYMIINVIFKTKITLLKSYTYF